jgi:hypothetical protein
MLVTLAALLELRRLTTIYLSSLASRTHDGGPNVGRRGKATASIRRKAATGAGIKGEVQQQVSCLLVAWMRAMVRQESTELGNHEQDKR